MAVTWMQQAALLAIKASVAGPQNVNKAALAYMLSCNGCCCIAWEMNGHGNHALARSLGRSLTRCVCGLLLAGGGTRTK